MNTKAVGLDIGSTSIKVALVKKTGTTVALEAVASIPQTTKGFASDNLVDIESQANMIRELMGSANIRVKDAILSIPESQTFTKIIEMPELSEAELSAALKFEMEQYIPMPVDQVKTDWEILGRRQDAEGKKTMDVMIVAAPLGLLQKYQKIMDMAGLYPDAIETELVSVHRSLLPLINTKGSSMIVHIGANSTSIAAVREGRIKMIFSIGMGGLALTRTISIDLGIDVGQAENYKKVYGLSMNAFEGKIGKVLSPVLSSIAADINKAILSFKEKNNNENIEQLILSGGTALLPGLDVFLTNALSTQVVVGGSWSAYGITNVPDALVPEAPSYNVVMGLAMRNLL